MARRVKVKRSLDRKIFRRTAMQVHRKNLYPQNMRGGGRF